VEILFVFVFVGEVVIWKFVAGGVLKQELQRGGQAFIEPERGVIFKEIYMW